ncbi:hypothetical protein QA649_08925 [Bradyrhizobium sp. CB1717]|uniref:hypothetical protein n=1 Tax=Bradyrhizobium sp. CB1717 TaxID=3039154 RepID=UPI0024B1A8BF|nr:hypothetical protein [Bradyrhizobium sp. CB1717]WFU26313.1 hypothetical protein QA649_08925 [Bradyrhizobium sp. CB1717]
MTQRTIINWCEAYGLGRLIGGRWRVSCIALQMLLDGNTGALAKYLTGNREDPLITGYFARLNVPLPKK